MRKAMEMMITDDSIDGQEAARLTGVPPDLVQFNKRVVHRQMEIMGLHTGIRAGSELCALGTHPASLHEFMAAAQEKGLIAALQERDKPFGDYRTTDSHATNDNLTTDSQESS